MMEAAAPINQRGEAVQPTRAFLREEGMFDFIKKAVQGVRDVGASISYNEVFGRLVDCRDYIFDFDVTKLPSDLNNVDLETARGLGTASDLKRIASRAELLQTAHLLDMREYDANLNVSLPVAMAMALAMRLHASDHLDSDGEPPRYWNSTRDEILSNRHYHFSRTIGSLTKVERDVWKAALYWQSQNLTDRLSASDIHLLICWAGNARQNAIRPTFIMEDAVWPAYLKEVDRFFAEMIGTSYENFVRQQCAYFERTADHERLERIKHLDPEGVIDRFASGR